jgi:hypothetical protein
VPFLQRATTSTGGPPSPEAGPEPCAERLSADETDLAPAHRLLAALTQAMPCGPTQSPPSARYQEENLRRYCEEGMRRLADDGAGVILGRGAAVVLGKQRGFHVRLDGPPALRVVQGAAIEGIAVDEARRRMDAADRARVAYVRRLYRADPADPGHYHLVIDSTSIPLDAVTEVILRSLSSFPAAIFAQTATPPLLSPGNGPTGRHCALLAGASPVRDVRRDELLNPGGRDLRVDHPLHQGLDRKAAQLVR